MSMKDKIELVAHSLLSIFVYSTHVKGFVSQRLVPHIVFNPVVLDTYVHSGTISTERRLYMHFFELNVGSNPTPEPLYYFAGNCGA